MGARATNASIFMQGGTTTTQLSHKRQSYWRNMSPAEVLLSRAQYKFTHFDYSSARGSATMAIHFAWKKSDAMLVVRAYLLRGDIEMAKHKYSAAVADYLFPLGASRPASYSRVTKSDALHARAMLEQKFGDRAQAARDFADALLA